MYREIDEKMSAEFRALEREYEEKRRQIESSIDEKFRVIDIEHQEESHSLDREFNDKRYEFEEKHSVQEDDDFMSIIPPEELEEIERIKNTIMKNVSMDEIESHWSIGDKDGLLELILTRTDLTKEQVLRIMMYAEKHDSQRDYDDGYERDYDDGYERDYDDGYERDYDDKFQQSLGPDERWTELSERFAELESKLAQKELKLAEKEKELATKEALLEEKLAKRELKIEERENALQRAIELIEKLEQRIQGLEQRMQSLLDKVETGEYFGPTDDVSVNKSYSLVLEGTASSDTIDKVESFSADLFIETLSEGISSSKFQITGGELHVGDSIYDVAFGKARTLSSGSDGLKHNMILIGQVMDNNGDTSAIKLAFTFEGNFETIEELADMSFKIVDH